MPGEYYRLPWTLTDKAISCLEVTGGYKPDREHFKNDTILAPATAFTSIAWLF